MDPLSFVGGDFMPKLQGGAGGSAGPSSAFGGDSSFDSSGWNVNFGGGSISSSRADALGQYMPYVIAAAAVLIVWRMTKKR
jgi:hypothetical protein